MDIYSWRTYKKYRTNRHIACIDDYLLKDGLLQLAIVDKDNTSYHYGVVCDKIRDYPFKSLSIVVYRTIGNQIAIYGK